MYKLDDTIVAVSSPTSDKRVIVRLSGPATADIMQQLFSPPIAKYEPGILRGSVSVDSEFRADATLYKFCGPHSYTGEDVAELHIFGNRAVTEALIDKLLGSRAAAIRPAEAGECTVMAYLNGKIDLTQAEAVNEVIVTGNRFQLAAAEKLLAGRLAETTNQIGSRLCDCLSLIEAGLDFSQEDMEFITRADAVRRLTDIKNQLEQLLSASINCEGVIDLPAVGIAGAPNAGKSSLLNTLLGRPRSIVSDQSRTTRDVLTGLLKLRHCECVLFDCAGLITEPGNILDELAQQAAIEALRTAAVTIFCVDLSKEDWGQDLAIAELIEPEATVMLATKSDSVSQEAISERLERLNRRFDAEFVAISAETGAGIKELGDSIERRIIELAAGFAEHEGLPETRETKHGIALTARHRQAVTEAIENVGEAVKESEAENEEVAAMMLRAAYQAVSTIEQEPIDEQVLGRIFSRFCIGK
jgi:tRNA modification GTPase